MEPTALQHREAPPRRVEMLAGLSVAIDLGLGQPAEHMLRSAAMACRIADRLGLTPEERATVYYTSLLMWVGCHADSQEYAQWFGDDIAVRRDAYRVDWTGLPYLRFLVGAVGRGEPFLRRLALLASLFRDARGQLSALIHSHCMSAAALAHHMGLPSEVEEAVRFTFERYDGGGLPVGCSGEEIPIEMRVAQVADVVEVFHRLHGVEGAVAMARSRRGGQFDPVVVDALLSFPHDLIAGPPGSDAWSATIAEAPDAEVRLGEESLDLVSRAVGDFADLKCPFTLGHSRAVASLAADTARVIGLEESVTRTLRRAGYLHDVGKLGVSNQVWSKRGELESSEWERVRIHPYLTDRVLSRISGLSEERAIARSHHERLDGSGYPQGIGGSALGIGERILAAVVTYQSALEPRPYRTALTPDEAARRLRLGAANGQLDPPCVDAVLTASGHPSHRTRRADGLTPREREVVGLVALGLNNREIAGRLVLSEKTVRNHVERAYAKIGANNRVGASLYALEHGLVP
jgi:HD-GYP domain-containing protein (c-di-GMP phosphodiesterase class II)